MPGDYLKAKRLAVSERRAKVAALYHQRFTQVEIAAMLGVSQQMIGKDIKMLDRAWKSSGLRDFNADRERALAELAELQREYYRAWRRSQEQREIKTAEQSDQSIPAGKKAAAVRSKTMRRARHENRDGDPRFLEGVRWCFHERCKILGLFAPDVTVHEGQIQINWPNASPMADIITQAVPVIDGTDNSMLLPDSTTLSISMPDNAQDTYTITPNTIDDAGSSDRRVG